MGFASHSDDRSQTPGLGGGGWFAVCLVAVGTVVSVRTVGASPPHLVQKLGPEGNQGVPANGSATTAAPVGELVASSRLMKLMPLGRWTGR